MCGKQNTHFKEKKIVIHPQNLSMHFAENDYLINEKFFLGKFKDKSNKIKIILCDEIIFSTAKHHIFRR